MNMAAKKLLRKVPEVTAIFWIAKLLTTAMGEAISDFFANAYNPYLVVVLAAAILAITLVVQFRAKKYIPWVYWITVSMVAVFGTMAADVLHKQFGVAYSVTTPFFALSLGIIFAVWYKVEKTLSIHSIYTTRREIFYWLTVMATFALGTAAGDWTAYTLGLGYFTSALVFAAMMLIPIAGYRLKFNTVFTFWLAYIITRPLGASLADWFGKPVSVSGLGYGDGTVSLILAVLIIACVYYMTYSRKEIKEETNILS